MARFEAATGRYVYLDVQGVEYRVYFEEHGQGIPLVCQHTAGADGRQWRHFLTDAGLTAKFRVVVPDLPFHGKSLPPDGVAWWRHEYRLSKRFFIDFHLALNRALGLARPVFIGSSMGGHLAPDLALECPDEYRAVIGLEASLKSGAGPDEDIRQRLHYLRHPRVNAQERIAASMYCLTAPMSAEGNRREAAWVYSQGGPGVFAGDLHYYFFEHDLRETAGNVDTTRCPVYIMNAEYDPATNIEEGEDLVARMPGARFVPLHGLGHFPMTEDFAKLKTALMPVLDEIARRA